MRTTSDEIRLAAHKGDHETAARLAQRLIATMGACSRENWLARIVEELRPRLVELGAPLPERIRVSVGFPSKRPLAKRNRRIGECWSHKLDREGAPHIFVSPLLGEVEAAECLVHELVHAAAPEAGHRGEFARLARALNLEGPLTATKAGPILTAELAAIRRRIGAYPHAALDVKALEEDHKRTKDSTRQRKAVCSCGRILRMSRKVADEGPVLCGLCGEPFVVELGEGA